MTGAIGGLVMTGVGIASYMQQERGVKAAEKSGEADEAGEKRAQREDKERRKRAEGPPVRSTPGWAGYYESRFAFPERTTHLGPVAHYDYGSEEYAEWFRRNKATAVGVRAYRVTMEPLHEGTVIVQNMRVTNLRCMPTAYDGTAVVPPSIGDGGEDMEPVTVAFDLSAPSPSPRRIRSNHSAGPTTKDTWHLGSGAFRKGVYLDGAGGEQADARAFDLYFFTAGKDCSFGVEANVTSGGTDAWYPLDISSEASERRGFVAGMADRYASVVSSVNVNGAQEHRLHGPGNPFGPLDVRKDPL